MKRFSYESSRSYYCGPVCERKWNDKTKRFEFVPAVSNGEQLARDFIEKQNAKVTITITYEEDIEQDIDFVR